jgi:hypothetical protein
MRGERTVKAVRIRSVLKIIRNDEFGTFSVL